MSELGPTVRRPLVLTVDDDADFCETLEGMLVHMGFRVSIARSGAAALQAVEEEMPALILLDIYMPEMDGLALLSALHKAAIYTPVVIASGAAAMSGQDPLVTAAINLGADGFLHKPFTAQEMERLIGTLLPALSDAAAAEARP